jgi:hypothetical protein
MTDPTPRIEPARFEPGFEHPSADEAATIAGIVKANMRIAETVARDEGHAFRSVHAKGHGIVLADLEVLPGLSPQLAQGLFAATKGYPVVMRFSTTPGDMLPDKVSTPRGVALKVIGVDGPRVVGSEHDRTQDFVLVNGAAFPAPNAEKFLKNLQLLAATTDRMPRTKNALSAALRGAETLLEKTGLESATFKSLGGHPATHILGETFFSQVPILYGDYIAKVALFPTSPSLTAHTGEPIEVNGHDDALRDAVSRHFALQDAEWELRVQLCTNPERMPIEDASIEWSQKESPYVPVARLRARRQVTWSARRIATVEDGMSFSPWHALAAHRPLGSVMRVRRVAYEAAAAFRARSNGVAMAEPRMVPTLEE